MPACESWSTAANGLLCRKTQELVEKLKQPPEDSKPLKFKSRYSRKVMDQFRLLLLRNSREYWRMPDYNTVRIYFTCLFGLVLGAVYWRIGTERCARLYACLQTCIRFGMLGSTWSKQKKVTACLQAITT